MFFFKKIGWVKYQWIYLSVTNCSKLQTASVKLGFGKIPWNSKSQHFKMASHSSHLEMFPSIQAPHFPMICGDELLMLWVLYRDLSLMILVVLYRIQFTMIDCWHFFTIIQDLVPHSQHVSFDSRPEPPNEYLRLTAYHDNTACSMLHFLLFYQWLESFFNWNSCRIPRSRWAISLSHWRVRRKISQTLKHPWLLMKGWINGQFHMCCFDFCQLIFWVKVHFPGKEGLFFGYFWNLWNSELWGWFWLQNADHCSGFNNTEVKIKMVVIQNHGCLVDPHFLLIQECIVVTLIKPLMLMFHDFCWLSFGGHWRVATATICREKYTSQCTYDHRNSPVPTTLLLWSVKKKEWSKRCTLTGMFFNLRPFHC